jgi:hypothetical protein
MWELIKELSVWTGWFPITIGAVIVMLLGKYFYDREINFKDSQIEKLKDDLEDLKQYTPSLLIQNLGKHVKEYEQEIGRLNERLRILNDEVATETRKKSVIEQERNDVLSQLEIAHSDVLKLKDQLKSYEDDLDDLVEDYCEICDPDENHSGENFINWGSAVYPLTGLEELVEKVGTCNYCSSPQIKCSICGSITSINLDDYDKVECAGECGVKYQIVVDYHEHDYEIEVSREDN